jgi:hypothetical protein
MYEELVKRLRDDEAWKNCDFDFIYGWMHEAADAIEELSNAGSIYGKAWTLGYDAGRDENRPRWIPVTERLPEKKKAHYLCLLDDDSMAVVYWSKVPDWASKGEWTWHNPNWKEVTHWMPLPTPPKEE